MEAELEERRRAGHESGHTLAAIVAIVSLICVLVSIRNA
jgi:hypothetical protein